MINPEIKFKPELYKFASCKEFLENFTLTEKDLVFTNRYIFDPFFGRENITAGIIYQEDFGTGEPTDTIVEEIIAVMEQSNYERIFAIGGGSVLDIAKILAVADGSTMDEMYEKMPNLTLVKKLYAIPTTCGTGSEVTNIAVTIRTKLGIKMGLVSSKMFPKCAILIPELLTTLPYDVFATSSIDALIHAVEAALSPNATDFTKLFSYNAIKMICHGYMRLAEEGKEILPELLDDFLTASTFAGLAFGTAGCGTVHAMSFPLGGKYGVAHGESNYVIFMGVINYYLATTHEGAINELLENLGEILHCEKDESSDKLALLLSSVIEKKSLENYGVTKEDLPMFSKSVMDKQTRLLNNSFVPMNEESILAIYETIY